MLVGKTIGRDGSSPIPTARYGQILYDRGVGGIFSYSCDGGDKARLLSLYHTSGVSRSDQAKELNHFGRCNTLAAYRSFGRCNMLAAHRKRLTDEFSSQVVDGIPKSALGLGDLGLNLSLILVLCLSNLMFPSLDFISSGLLTSPYVVTVAFHPLGGSYDYKFDKEISSQLAPSTHGCHINLSQERVLAMLLKEVVWQLEPSPKTKPIHWDPGSKSRHTFFSLE